MFILKGDKRINFNLIRQYKPIEQTLSDNKFYLIEFIFLDGYKDEINFFKDIKWRNRMMETLDKLYLKQNFNE
jgi:hypothetical protein